MRINGLNANISFFQEEIYDQQVPLSSPAPRHQEGSSHLFAEALWGAGPWESCVASKPKGVGPPRVTLWSWGHFQGPPPPHLTQLPGQEGALVRHPPILPDLWLENLCQNSFVVKFWVLFSQNSIWQKIYIFIYLFLLSKDWTVKAKTLWTFVWKKKIGAVANGLWSHCLAVLSTSLQTTVSPEVQCGKCAALASLQRRESARRRAWSQELTAETPSQQHLWAIWAWLVQAMSKFHVQILP